MQFLVMERRSVGEKIMQAHHSEIKEAYRAALADQNSCRNGMRGRALIGQTASLASLWTNGEITEANVMTVLKSLLK